MHSSPLVSVIIPAYNAVRWIDKSIESAQAQTLRDIEIVVVDDGSTDATAEVAAGHASRDPRIRIVRRPNAGVGAARNAGIRAARGGFIAPLDADDVWDPAKLDQQVRRFEERGGRTGLVFCWSRVVDEEGRDIGAIPSCAPEGDLRRALLLRNFLGNASVPLFRAEALRQTGLYITREEQAGAQGCEDWDLSLRVAEQWHLGAVAEFLVGYRQHGTNMSSSLESMAASFRCILNRARQRNRDLPDAMFRWAEGHFYGYLANCDYRSGRYRPCLTFLARALRADPLMALNSQVIRTGLDCLLAVATNRTAPGPSAKPRSAPVVRPSAGLSNGASHKASNGLRPYSIFPRIQKRRWNAALSKRP